MCYASKRRSRCSIRTMHSLVFFLRPGDHNTLHHLYLKGQKYQKEQQESTGWTPAHQPVRTFVAIALFQELGVRLERAQKEENLANKIKALGWRDPSVGWKYQRWDPTVKALVEDSSWAPISDQTAASHLLSNHGAGHRASLFVQGQARGHQRSGDDCSDGLVHQNPGCSRGVVGSDGIVGLQTPTVERHRLQARDIASEPDGQEDLQSRLRALRLVLHNPGNSC